MRRRCHVRTVRLDHDPLQRHRPGGLHRPAGVLIGQHAGKGDHPAQPDQLLRHLRAAGKAVEHPPDPGEFPHHCQTVGVGLPVVDDHRQVQLLRQGHLVPEDPPLVFPGGILLPVVVQADLPDGHHPGVLRPLPEEVQLRRVVRGAVLRMVAHGGIEEGPGAGQRHRRAGGGDVAPGIHRQGDAPPDQPRQNGLPVPVKLLRIVVRVGVKEHGGQLRTISAITAAAAIRPRMIQGTGLLFCSRAIL